MAWGHRCVGRRGRGAPSLGEECEASRQGGGGMSFRRVFPTFVGDGIQ